MNKEEYVYRIMSIYEFYELYINKKLKLTRLSCQEDKNDGVEFILHSINRGFHLPEGKALYALQEYRKGRYVSCWTKNYDSVAMWSIYSPHSESIRIKVKKEDLKKHISIFSEEYDCFKQWGRESNDLLSDKLVVYPTVFIEDASYRNIRKLMEEINEKKNELYCKMKEKAKDNSIYWHSDEYIEDFMSFKPMDIPSFTKDDSFSHEQEIRFEIIAGIRDLDYKSFEDYKANSDELYIPILNDTDDLLPPVLYANVEDDFIKEICFDPRMPDYKKETLIKMMNIDLSKIKKSNCFEPIIDQYFAFDPLKGIIKKDAN